MTEYEDIPLPQFDPTPEQLEELRQIGMEMILDMGFHEIAIADPFKAEAKVNEYGRRIQKILGHPKGWVMYAPVEDAGSRE